MYNNIIFKIKSAFHLMLNLLIDAYTWLAITGVTIVLFLLALFGGQISIIINWKSWTDLINSFKK